MTHREFLDKWLGKKYEETPELGVQCVGGAKLYCRERGFPIGAFGGSAIRGWKTGLPFNSSWKKIEYKKGLFPNEGDIIFWDTRNTRYGHVGVCNKHCNKDLIRYIDQNGGGKGEGFTARFSDYKGVLGWYSIIK